MESFVKSSVDLKVKIATLGRLLNTNLHLSLVHMIFFLDL